jgi:hypothetical protein
MPFDESDPCPESGGPCGSDETSCPGTDDDEVVTLGWFRIDPVVWVNLLKEPLVVDIVWDKHDDCSS